MSDDPEKDLVWFERPENRRLLWKVLGIACGLSLIAEFFIHRHAHFGWVDGWFGFYGIFGFVACAAMVWLAKSVGHFLKRPENYYEEPSPTHLSDDVDPDLQS